jgi:hypothetical protein
LREYVRIYAGMSEKDAAKLVIRTAKEQDKDSERKTED